MTDSTTASTASVNDQVEKIANASNSVSTAIDAFADTLSESDAIPLGSGPALPASGICLPSPIWRYVVASIRPAL